MWGIKMRIAFVVGSYYPNIGGVEIFVKKLAERMKNKRHEVIVITEGKCEKKAAINGVTTYWLKGRKFGFKKMTWLENFGNVIEAESPDAIVCFGHGHLFCLQAARAADGKRKLLIVTYGPLERQNSSDLIEKVLGKLYDAIVTPYLFGKANTICYRTPVLKEWCKKIAKGNAIELTTAIGDEFFKGGKKRGGHKNFVIGYAGTVCRRKGLHILIEAFGRLKGKEIDCLGKNAKFLLRVLPTGGIETENDYEAKIKNGIKLQKLNMEFLEPIDPYGGNGIKKLVKFFDCIDLFVLPSAAEGISQAMLQAMARQKPVLIGRMENIAELIGERQMVGLNSEEIAEKVEAIARDKKLVGMLGRQNRKIAEGFRMSKIAGKFEDVLREING